MEESATPSLFRHRRQRQFIPDSRKDVTYWDRRRRNNEAAKRSREKRRINDMLLEARVQELDRENAALRAQLDRANAELARFRMTINSEEDTFSPYPPDMMETRYHNINANQTPLNLSTAHFPDSPPSSASFDSSPPPPPSFPTPQDLSLPHKLRFKRQMSLGMASDDGSRSRNSVESFSSSSAYESGILDEIKKET